MPIPQHIRAGLDRYVKGGIKTGGFLYAVLTNDLFEAVGRADIESRINLFDICDYIYNKVPLSCWGSKEKVKEWIDKFRKKESQNGNTSTG